MDLRTWLESNEVSLARSCPVDELEAREPRLGEMLLTFLPKAKSIVITALSYCCEKPRLEPSPSFRGTIAPYTWANFYRILHKSLKRLAKSLPGRSRISVNGLLPEKEIALAMGIGGRGLNSLVLTEDFGSLVVLGVLLSEAEVPKTKVLVIGGRSRKADDGSPCLNCRACIDACPSQALGHRASLNEELCIQALCSRAVELPKQVVEVWGNRFYGCSSCQDACPLNRFVPRKSKIPAQGRVGASMELLPILSMDEGQYRQSVSGNQISARWVDFLALQRNAYLALRNQSQALAKETMLGLPQLKEKISELIPEEEITSS